MGVSEGFLQGVVLEPRLKAEKTHKEREGVSDCKQDFRSRSCKLHGAAERKGGGGGR